MDEEADLRQALVDLIDLSKPFAAAVRSLSAHRWGAGPNVFFGGRQIIRALEMFLAGDLDASELERWADAIEGRDDIEYDPSCSSVVADFLFDASTPQLNGVFTEDRAAEWIRRFT